MTGLELVSLATTVFLLVCWGASHLSLRAENERLRIEHRDEVADLRDEVAFVKAERDAAERRAGITAAAVTALTLDLAASRRANMLLRTGILDAEREVNEMAGTLGLPIDLAERRAR